MRITGGSVKGRRLHTPKGLSIRPTSDRVREAVFNILGQDLSGLNVLDMFSGTGSLGIEALSRGAERAVFMDRLRESIGLIRKNIDLCGYGESAKVIRVDLAEGIPWKHSLMTKQGFDLIFLDPPYSRNLAVPVLAEISSKGRFGAGARVIVESEKAADLPQSFHVLERADSRVYGDTRITIYMAKESGTGDMAD